MKCGIKKCKRPPVVGWYDHWVCEVHWKWDRNKLARALGVPEDPGVQGKPLQETLLEEPDPAPSPDIVIKGTTYKPNPGPPPPIVGKHGPNCGSWLNLKCDCGFKG